MDRTEETYTINGDHLDRIAAIMRRLYSQDRMTGDTMRNAAQMLDGILNAAEPHYDRATRPHVTYDNRIK